MIVVRRPGPLTTVQDLGRPGWAHLGVPAAGAVDRRSLRLANDLVGNPPGAAGLEVTLGGLEVETRHHLVVALTGAAADLLVEGTPAARSAAVAVPAGARLRVGTARRGVRCYLAVRGGVAVAPVLGSRSTDTMSGLGPAPLRAGDELPVGDAVAGPPSADPAPEVPLPDAPTLRVLAGPRVDAFTAEAPAVLGASPYTVLPASDRTGVRLSGPPLPRRDVAELPSEGMVTGAVQVPPDGAPIVFLANHPTTGGYPVVGVVVDADVPLAAQARPGSALRFQVVG